MLSIPTVDGVSEVEAELVGVLFAVHPCQKRGGQEEDWFSVTHVTSGRCLPWSFSERDARRVAKVLGDELWSRWWRPVAEIMADHALYHDVVALVGETARDEMACHVPSHQHQEARDE